MKVPEHIGIIIDGNRRWARARGMKPWMGHWKGVKNLEKILNDCLELNVPEVSVYTLSTENLKRSKRELDELFKIFYHYFDEWEKEKDDGFLEKYQVKVRFIGDLERLPPKLVRTMGRIMRKTAKYQKRALNILIAYGSKFEIKEAMKKIAEKIIKTGGIEISEKDIEANLFVKTPIDLLIRTGGANRLSNFMLWQNSYAELYFTKKYWPDFSKKDLIKAIDWFNKQQRNFGK
jgi:tritrans,polycis-undecaprenyl-diphosphate synthase [geranylgeranyl-diphosphate specific]